MKNSTLILRSLCIIVLFTGSAQLVTYAAQNKDTISKEHATTSINNTTPNWETDYIVGKWKVNYSTEEFKGAVIYDIQKKGNVYVAYTYEYQDEAGNGEKAEKTKTLIIESFDGYKGKGIYKTEYEGNSYDIACAIDMVDENTFKLSYEVYGYSDVETWKRVKL